MPLRLVDVTEPNDPTPLFNRVISVVQADDRLLAALVFGSHATGTADAFSDVDIGLVVTDGAYDTVVAGRDDLVAALGDPLLTEDFGTPANVHVINADGPAYELILVRAADLDLGRPYRVLIDKTEVVGAQPAREPAPRETDDQADEVRRLVSWFWHDLEHVITALGRGQVLWAHGGLEDLRSVCIGLARMTAGADPEPEDPYWKVDLALSGELVAALRATLVPAEVGAMRDAALALVQLYRELAPSLAKAHGIAYPAELDRLLTARLQQD